MFGWKRISNQIVGISGKYWFWGNSMLMMYEANIRYSSFGSENKQYWYSGKIFSSISSTLNRERLRLATHRRSILFLFTNRNIPYVNVRSHSILKAFPKKKLLRFTIRWEGEMVKRIRFLLYQKQYIFILRFLLSPCVFDKLLITQSLDGT